MKQIFAFVVIACLGIGSAQACVKKQAQAEQTKPLTVIVTDTTQALLANVELRAGKQVFRTSYDGRVVLQPEQLKGIRKIDISCAGYASQKLELSDSHAPVIVLAMVPAAVKTVKPTPVHHGYVLGGAVRRDEPVRELVMVKTVEETGPAEPLMATSDHKIMAEYEGDAMPERTAGSSASNVKAGMLTAGEVNDYTKWLLWFSVLEGSHAPYVKNWRIEPRERYTVQAMTKHGYPVVNYPVTLTDEKGNTVFQTLTNNAGRAELWNGLITMNGQRAKVKKPEKVIIVDEECDDPASSTAYTEDVDVLFVFDATGSMGDELRYLQAEMRDVIARAESATGGLKIRTGAVVYRDFGDTYLTRISRLTSDIAATQTFIDKQEAGGGGDYPEAVPEALMAAINSGGWNESARARIAFLILDAPCHEDSATLARLHDQILNAAAQGIRIVPVVCSGLSEKGEFLMRSIALATNGTSFFLTDDSGIGHSHLKPTTDSLVVEHLNDMLVRTIVEFSYMPDCTGHWNDTQIANVPEQFIPDPFSTEDLTKNPSLPHGETTLFLLDISGKLITVYQGNIEDAGDRQLSALRIPLTTGIYFVKAYYDGQWHTKKILVH